MVISLSKSVPSLAEVAQQTIRNALLLSGPLYLVPLLVVHPILLDKALIEGSSLLGIISAIP